MTVPNIVIGQRVSGEKVVRARELRRVMTPEELSVWERLRGSQLGGMKFRRQQVIDGFIADIYCHSAAVVVEVDGGVHEGRADYDAGRDRIFRQRGLTVLRFTNDQVRSRVEWVLEMIAGACRRPHPPGPPLRSGEGGASGVEVGDG